MKSKTLRDMDDDQLIEFVRNTKEALFNLRFQQATGELENTARIGQTKRDVARALTIVRERDIDLGKEAAE